MTYKLRPYQQQAVDFAVALQNIYIKIYISIDHFKHLN